MARVIVKTNEIGDYLAANDCFLKANLELMAADDENHIAIYLTIEGGSPTFQVESDGRCVHQKIVYSRVELERVYREFLSTYLDYEEENLSAGQIDRLSDIIATSEDFVRILIQRDPRNESMFDVDFLDLADSFARELHDRYGFDIYFPLVCESDNGQVVLDYPYNDKLEEEVGYNE